MKNKNTYSVSALLLAMVLVIFLLIGCANDSSVNTGTTSSGTTAGSIETTTEYKLNLPEKDFNGETITFLVVDISADQYDSREIYAENENGELINDTVYRRNISVEDRYNVHIQAIKDADAVSTARRLVQSGDSSVDVYMPYLNPAVSLAQSGMLMDLYDIPYIGLENPWWDQRANENLEINNKLFFTTGDISILDNECTMVMFFNKTLVQDNALDNPYDLVKNGKWTIDKVFDMAKKVTRDIDGDDQFTHADLWGMSIATNAPHSFYFGTGERIAEKDANGNWQLDMSEERSINVIDKILSLCLGEGLLNNKVKGGDDFYDVCDIFTSGRLMFTTFALADMSFFRNADVNFGILPYPKLDEEQAEYNNLISTGLVPGLCVPITATNLEKIGIVCEALAYESVSTLTYAYYDQTLNTRLIRDTESSEMLDIIFKTRVYDLGYIYNWNGIGNLIQDIYSSKKTEFVSAYEKKIDAAREKMQADIDAYSKTE